jgi:toxin ParE1/3/4
MRLKYLSLAIQDLAAIRAFFAAENPCAAQQVGSRIRDMIQALKQMPHLGKPGRVFDTRELNTPKIGKTSYVVVYRVKQEEVQILRVLPGMRDLDAILEEGLGNEQD